MARNSNNLESRLWDAADELRANSSLTAAEYSTPVLGLIFLKYADYRFTQAEKELAGTQKGRRTVGKVDYQAKGVLYLPEHARFSRLVNLPESANVGQEINEAMKAIEKDNADLKGVLPKTYNRLDNEMLFELLRTLEPIRDDMEGDAFGKIYEYFLGNFAMQEGRGGGEFFTPTPIVRLIVEIIEPFYGRILDPACGSGGMFVQSARFVEEHQKRPSEEISIYGQDSKTGTVRLCKMNLAVHGLAGDIRRANSYYQDLHSSVGQFDFVMANPPFNVNRVDKDKLKGERARFPFGMPRADNANYLWIQLFYSSLNGTGRAGFVMANSAADARASELEIRQKLVEDRAVDVVVSVSPNFFYTVTLPCTLWFLDRGKKGTDHQDKVLFLDARHIYRQVDRAHREFAPEQIELLANIVRLYRGEEIELQKGSGNLLAEHFGEVPKEYTDVAGLCKVATVDEIEAQGWSLNPGRYVGVAERQAEEFDFRERLQVLNEHLEVLTAEARELDGRISANVQSLLEAE